MYTFYIFWIRSWQPVVQYLQPSKLSYWRAVVKSHRCRCCCFVGYFLKIHQQKTLAIKHKNKDASPLSSQSSLLLPWYWVSLSTSRCQTSGGSVAMATGRKSRCSTWEGCTKPLLLPLWEEEKPIHCEIIGFRNIFLPSGAVKEGTGILIHTIVAVTSTLKDAGNDQMHLLLHATSKLLPCW